MWPKTGKLFRGFSLFWAVLFLALLLATPLKVSSQEVVSLPPSLDGYSQIENQDQDQTLPDMPTPPEFQPIAIHPSATPMQEAIIRLKNWDQFWIAEKNWREQVITWSLEMKNLSSEQKKKSEKAIADKEAWGEGWHQSYLLLWAQHQNVERDKALIGGGSFAGGFLLGTWFGHSIK